MSDTPQPELPSDRLETELTAFAPRPPRLDRDRLMFEAGRAEALKTAGIPTPLRSIPWWLWPGSTLAMTAAAAALALALVWRPPAAPRVKLVDRYVYLPAPAEKNTDLLPVASSALRSVGEPLAAVRGPSLAALPPGHALRVRELILTRGVDALQSPANEGGPDAPVLTCGDFFRQMAQARGRRPPAAAGVLRWPDWLTPPPQQ
jgi:hypothetical protein